MVLIFFVTKLAPSQWTPTPIKLFHFNPSTPKNLIHFDLMFMTITVINVDASLSSSCGNNSRNDHNGKKRAKRRMNIPWFLTLRVCGRSRMGLKWCDNHVHFIDKSVTKAKMLQVVSANGINFMSWICFGFIILAQPIFGNKSPPSSIYNIPCDWWWGLQWNG